MLKLDLTGQVFGRLTVLEDAGRRNGRVLWKCLCDCGNIVDVLAESLRGGHTKSCGCYSKELTSQRNYVNLAEQIFGRLTVLEEAGRDKHGNTIWKCLCECGNMIEVVTGHLQDGHSQSCGCFRREQTSKRHYKNLTGKVFGRLTVLEDVGRKHGRVSWRCLCECGHVVDVISSCLQNGNTKSCGCYHKEQLSEAFSGENNWGWKGGVTPLRVAIRTCTKYDEWRTTIFQRDDYVCQHCHKIGEYLHAHHIKFFSTILDEYNVTTLEEALQCEALWNIENGITLCRKCHEAEHARLRALDIPEEMYYD
jgi:hypothetical protein